MAKNTLSATVSDHTYDVVTKTAADTYRTQAAQVRMILDQWVEFIERSAPASDTETEEIGVQ